MITRIIIKRLLVLNYLLDDNSTNKVDDLFNSLKSTALTSFEWYI